MRFGFRDELALGDANLVLAPLTRRTLVCSTARGERHTVLRTKAEVRSVDAILARAALAEVACHPDDELEVSGPIRNPPPTHQEAIGRADSVLEQPTPAGHSGQHGLI